MHVTYYLITKGLEFLKTTAAGSNGLALHIHSFLLIPTARDTTISTIVLFYGIVLVYLMMSYLFYALVVFLLYFFVFRNTAYISYNLFFNYCYTYPKHIMYIYYILSPFSVVCMCLRMTSWNQLTYQVACPCRSLILLLTSVINCL